MTIMDTLYAHINGSGLVSGWKVQAGKWTDSGVTTDKYVVVQSMTGNRAELIRNAMFRVLVIPPKSAAYQVGDLMAESLFKFLRDNYSKDDVFLFDPFDPVYFQTSDGREVWEINVAVATD